MAQIAFYERLSLIYLLNLKLEKFEKLPRRKKKFINRKVFSLSLRYVVLQSDMMAGSFITMEYRYLSRSFILY